MLQSAYDLFIKESEKIELLFGKLEAFLKEQKKKLELNLQEIFSKELEKSMIIKKKLFDGH